MDKIKLLIVDDHHIQVIATATSGDAFRKALRHELPDAKRSCSASL